MWFTPFEEKGTIIHSVSKQAAAIVALTHMTQQQRGPGEEYIILAGGGGVLNKYTRNITLHEISERSVHFSILCNINKNNVELLIVNIPYSCTDLLACLQ